MAGGRLRAVMGERIVRFCRRLRSNSIGRALQFDRNFKSRSSGRPEVLDPLDVTSDHAGVPLLDEDYLVLSTTHSAKGREWRSVFGAERRRRCIPSDLATGADAEIEEERRLRYVAMTRARDELHLLMPQRFFTHGQSVRKPSRLRREDPVYSRRTAWSVQLHGLAHGCRRTSRCRVNEAAHSA